MGSFCTYNYKDTYSCKNMRLDENETCIYCGAGINIMKDNELTDRIRDMVDKYYNKESKIDNYYTLTSMIKRFVKKEMVMFRLDRKDLKSLIKGTGVHKIHENNKIVQRAGYLNDDVNGIQLWTNLDDLSNDELYELYLICKNSYRLI